jgi:hypothetical protein
MINFTCDMCGNTIDISHLTKVEHISYSTHIERPFGYDLCNDCYNEMTHKFREIKNQKTQERLNKKNG